jgi:head-tail adaptor
MVTASLRTELIVFERATAAGDDYGGEAETWAEYVQRRARVRFGTAQEKREAAQEGGVQSATFECVRSAELDSVTLKDRISYLGSSWDITEVAPLDRKTIRFTGVRSL